MHPSGARVNIKMTFPTRNISCGINALAVHPCAPCVDKTGPFHCVLTVAQPQSIHFFRGRFGMNARNLRGLSTMIWCSTWSLTPAAFSFGRNTVNVFE